MKKFIKDHVNSTPIEDNVFAIVNLAVKAKAEKGLDKVVDATIGSLFDEEGQLVALNSVWGPYNNISNQNKAKYASSFSGNPAYRERIYTWLTENIDTKLAHRVIATPGGSGAVSVTMQDVLDAGDTVVLPNIAWGSYALMASMYNYNTVNYELFEGDHFNLKSFKEVCSKVMDEQGKVLAVINDPCHNPTGYTLTKEEWVQLVDIMNELSEKGPFILLNDVAYIDYSYDFANSRKYMETWNNISDNVMVVVAFSCSKTMTSYGLRCGAAVIFAQEDASVRQLEIVMEKRARATWSNIATAAMDNFAYVTTEGYEEFDKEKAYYVSLLKQRSDIFKEEANACGLPYYPYKEGFFITLKVEDQETLDKFHQALLDNDIYAIEMNKGIRVAVCSMPINKVKGLAPRMKEILDSVSK